MSSRAPLLVSLSRLDKTAEACLASLKIWFKFFLAVSVIFRHPEKGNVVPGYDRIVISIGDDLIDLVRLLSRQHPGFITAVVYYTPGKLFAGRVDNADDVTTLECALHVSNAGGKEAGFAFHKSISGALIDVNGSCDRCCECNPSQLSSHCFFRRKQGA